MKGTNGVPPLPAAPGFTEPLCPGSRARLEMSAPGGNGALLQLEGPIPGAADADGAARTGRAVATATTTPIRLRLMDDLLSGWTNPRAFSKGRQGLTTDLSYRPAATTVGAG
jgi:hypothetical protein